MRQRPLVSTLTLEPPPWPERLATRHGEALPLERSSEPFAVAVDPDEAVVVVSDRDADMRYELGARGLHSAGWSEHSQVHGDAAELRVSAAEVMAVVREAERDEQVAELTLTFAAGQAQNVARRLHREVRRGRELERVSVRAFQLRVLERLVAGEPLVEMCERGGFMGVDGRPDTSWFLRRIGLRVCVCSRTGRRRWARTLRYELGARYATALEQIRTSSGSEVGAMTTTEASAHRRPRGDRGQDRLAAPTQAVHLVLADGSRRVEALSPDLHTALFGRCLHEGRPGLVEVWAARRSHPEASLRPVTSRHDPGDFPDAGDLRALVQLARRHRKDREEAFASPLTRTEPGGGKRAVEEGRVIWIDVDDPGELGRLREFSERPHLVVASGRGLHAYWRLDRDLDGEELDSANRRLAAYLGGDPQAADRGRAMRLPGTINHKHGRWCRVVLCDLAGPALAPERLLGTTPADPRPPARRATRRRPAQSEPAADIPPPVYFARLAGIEVPDRGGYVRCPLHEERTASCMVWAEAERGFACFGCGVAGRIFDFASALGGGPTGRELRGEAFLEARRWVNAAFGLRA